MDDSNTTNEIPKAKTPKKTTIIFFVILAILILASSISFYFLISTKELLQQKTTELKLLGEEKSNLEAKLQNKESQINRLLAETEQCVRWPNSSIKKFISPYFKYLEINLSDSSKSLGNLYTSYWFWCGGSNGTRYLPNEYEKHLEQIGTIGVDKEVYAISNTTPMPTDQHLIPSEKDNSDVQLIITESKFPEEEQSKWSDFLNTQKEKEYPIVVVKNDEGKYLMHFRVDYMFLPGC